MSRLIVPPIESPALPFLAEIPGGSKVGLIIRIQGTVSGSAYRFSVNLACGPMIDPPQSNIAFHINPRFDKGYVARNTFADGVWGNEESQAPSHLPFVRGRPFEMMILVEPHQYKVAVDGTHFLEYNHRIPLPLIDTLQIMGDVQLYKVEFLDNEPPSAMSGLGFGNAGSAYFQPTEILDPSVPFLQFINGVFSVGRTITITGRPKPYATRFSINLEREIGGERDVLFHLNPRFGGLGDEKTSVVVRNSRLGSEWGMEERETPYFPFNHGFNFDLTILCERLDFLVAVNGQHLISFRHRHEFELIDSLHVSGDVDLVMIKIQ